MSEFIQKNRDGATARGRPAAAYLAVALVSCSSTATLSGFDEGAASYRSGNYADTFKQWSEAAQQGDSDAQYNLGCLYVRGEGVQRNPSLAVPWMQRATDQGDMDAATWLLFAYPVTDDRRKEFFARKFKPTTKFHVTFVARLSDGKDHRRPCSTDEKDGAQIEFELGLFYDKGTAGFPQDDTQAVEWYRRASARNFAAAQTNLAYLYAAGRGVEKNELEAARLFRRAAEQGNAAAQANLGSLYAAGSWGYRKDPILAYVLVSHAADTGSELARNSVAEFKPLLSSDQLLEAERLIEKWKGKVQWPAEIAERLGPAH